MIKKSYMVTVVTLALVAWCSTSFAADPLLDTLPNDAIAAFQINRPQQVMPRQSLVTLCELLLSNAETGKNVADTLVKLPGELVIGVLPAADGKVNFHVSVAADLKGAELDCDALVRNGVLPILARLNRAKEQQYDLDTTASIHRVIKTSNGNTIFAYARKKDVLLGCTQPQTVQDWVRGEWPGKPWTRDPGLRRALAKGSKNYAARVLINPISLGLPSAAEKPAVNSWREILHKILPPDEIESIVGEIELEKSTVSAQLKMVLGEKSEGLSRIVSRPATSSTQIGVFPEDFTLVGRLSLSSVQAIIDGIYAITDHIDPAISKEYREDLEAFKKDTGCDWDSALLGNVTGEIAFGTRVDFTKNPPISWAVVAPLSNEARFNAAIDRLNEHFKLGLDDKKYKGGSIREPEGSAPFAMATNQNRLLIADGKETLIELTKDPARKDLASHAMRELLNSLCEKNQFAILVDLDQILARTPLGMMAPPKFKKLIAGQIGATVTCQDRIARLDLRWNTRSSQSAGDNDESQPLEDSIISALTSGLGSIQQVRLQSQRTVSSANMRGIGQGFYIWAQDHKGSFPPDLKTLIESNNVTPQMFASPYEGQFLDENSNVDTEGYLLYRPGLTTQSPPVEILLAEKSREGMDGANFLFVDGHVEFIPEPKASELLKLMAENAPEIRYQAGNADR